MDRTMRSITLLFSCLLLTHLAQACGYDVLQSLARKWAKPILKEYRFPEKRDIKGDWLECKKTSKPCPYWTTGDYNGDGKKDCAFLLIRRDNAGYGIFGLISTGNKYRLHTLEVENDSYYNNRGVVTVPPGKYQTAKGKGYEVPDSTGPDSLDLTYEAVDCFVFESSDIFYYWSPPKSQFKKVWITD